MTDDEQPVWIASRVLSLGSNAGDEYHFRLAMPVCIDRSYWICRYDYRGPNHTGKDAGYGDDSLQAMLAAIQDIRKVIDEVFEGKLYWGGTPHSGVPVFVPWFLGDGQTKDLESYIRSETTSRMQHFGYGRRKD